MRPKKTDGGKSDPPCTLVPDALSHETIDCLRTLLREAERGQVLGIAFAAMLRGRAYIVNTAGECYLDRTFSRGMVLDLQEKLRAP